jgi:hypothetical protein
MQRNLDGAPKPRQLEYVTTTTEASGQEQISRSTCNLQEPLPWPFRRLGKSIHLSFGPLNWGGKERWR